MAQKSNDLEKFWQELKRRKVFGVVTTYSATAYIIIEVANNLAIPLHLPDWFITLILIILLIGLPIVVILSWIFDFTPQGIKKTESLEESEETEIQTKPVKRRLRSSYVLNAILIIAVLVLAYPKLFKHYTLENLRAKGRITVAVMPFQNLTNDTIWNVWQDGIQDILITSLSNSDELKVRQTESTNGLLQSKGLTNYASITPSVASALSQKLDANVFIHGGISRAGSAIRVNAHITDSKTKEVFKSFNIDGSAREEVIFHIIDSLSVMIKDYLIISKLKKDLSHDIQQYANTNSPEAFKYYIYGNNSFARRDYATASTWYLQSLNSDSAFINAAIWLSISYWNQGLYKEGERWVLKIYEKRAQMTDQQRIWTNLIYAGDFEPLTEVIKYCRQLLEIDDQQPIICYQLGWCYNNLYQYGNAIPEFEKALEIYNKWGSKPMWVPNYTELGYAYHKTGQYKKENRLYKKAEKDFPDDPDLIYNQAVLSLTEGDTITANRYIENYTSIRKENSVLRATIMNSLASIYYNAGISDKAEEYERLAHLSEPENALWLNNLAWYLIDSDRNINEGMILVDKALALNPDKYEYLDTKGWGLYKQGNYKEALEVLQKSWDLKPIYDHGIYLHLEAAKKAVASQKNN